MLAILNQRHIVKWNHFRVSRVFFELLLASWGEGCNLKKKKKARREFISRAELKGGSHQSLTLVFCTYLVAKVDVTAMNDFLDNT